MAKPAGFEMGALTFLGAVVRSGIRFPRTALRPAVGIVLGQFRFTCVHALPFLVGMAALLLIPVMARLGPMAAQLGFEENFNRILLTALIRELAPVVPALLVVARSGTAVAGELSTAAVVGEKEALEALGVDPLQYYVVPRVVAFALSVVVLTVFFDALILIPLGLDRARVGELPLFLATLRATVQPADVWITVIKATLFGAGIALLCSKEGLDGPAAATNIPVSVSRATVASLFWVLGVSAAFAVLAFLI